MNVKRILFLLGFLPLISCNVATDKQLESVMAFAGKNRVELEKVLLHYKNDPEKLQAARFLLSHMKDRCFYRSEGIDSIHHYLKIAARQESCLPFDVERKWGAYNYKSETPVYDVQVLSSDYLIENIDLAFEAWHYREWSKYYSFDDFCHYLLPYWIGNEKPDNWRKVFAEHFRTLLDSLYQGTDVVVAVDSLQHFLKRTYPFCYNNDFVYPNLGGEFLLQYAVGACREETDFMVYLLRSIGIPVAVDHYIYSPDAYLGHSWNVFKDTTGCFIPTELLRTDVSRNWRNHRRKGKVYREFVISQSNTHTFLNERLIDVTTDYYPSNQVVIPYLERENGEKEGLIGVFSLNGWLPIAKYVWEKEKALVKNIEVDGLIYQPLRQKGNRWFPSGYPFLTDKRNNAIAIIPDTTHTETVILTRKHPLTRYWMDVMHEMDGVRIYGSIDSDFSNQNLLGELICDSVYSRKKFIELKDKNKYRYIKVCPPPGKRLNISELVIYEDAVKGKTIKCNIVYSDTPLGGVSDYSANKALDGDNLSRFEAMNPNTDFIIELDRPLQIDKILYVSRNDDNYITLGDAYELFYQDGVKGWKSLGVKKATEEQLIYTNVPANALLWLHNHTKGVEEQVFRWENGKQIFCYRD